MARITRRRVLKLSGAGVVAAQTGGLAAVLATGRAPAYAQGTNIHWLRWADFVPASDVLLKGQITQECQKETGITLKLETINANDLQSRVTSAIQSGTGADITMALGIRPQLYAESLVDAGDVAEEIGKAQGGYYDVSKLVATVGNKWIGVPWAIGGALVAYRKSWFDEIGYNTFPETWDALLDAGLVSDRVGVAVQYVVQGQERPNRSRKQRFEPGGPCITILKRIMRHGPMQRLRRSARLA
jgi:multiple sugar transport system substrate-binding protein